MRTPLFFVMAAFLLQEAPQAPLTIRVETQLVLAPFHVVHNGNNVRDLKSSDVILLEDGKPREFTIFDGPQTQGRLPLELVLLFDTNPKIDYFWDPKDVFRFVSQWKDEMSNGIFRSDAADIRVSVYRCSGSTLYKMSSATKDPHQFGEALRRLWEQDLFEGASTAIPLSLPATRRHVDGGFTDQYVTSYFYSAESRGWPMEAGIGILNDLATSERLSRVFVMFSEGIGATTTIPGDLGNQALDLGIPVFPIVTNYKGHIQRSWPRNFFRMREFASLGKMTGGRAIEYTSVDAQGLAKILQTVISDGLSQYVVGFVPEPGDGPPKEHKLEVRIARKSKGTIAGGLRRATY